MTAGQTKAVRRKLKQKYGKNLVLAIPAKPIMTKKGSK